jgi:hypothetical protein
MFVSTISFAPVVTGIVAVLIVTGLAGTKFEVKGVVGPYFGALAIMFGLFASLMAGDTWREISRANALLAKEVNSLRAIDTLAKSAGQGGEEIRALASRYALEDLEAEQQMTAHQGTKLTELPALIELQNFVLKNDIGSQLLGSRMFLHIDELRDARLQRLEIKKNHSGPRKLAMLLILGALTQLAIAMCHSGNKLTASYTVGLFTFAFALVIHFATVFDDSRNFDQVVDLSVLKTVIQ